MKIVILLPTYNERYNLPLMIDAILDLNMPLDILILDDNSPDGTGKIADNLQKQHTNVKVIHRPNKEGLGKAYIQGFQTALSNKYNKIITMDCDFSHDCKYLPKMLQIAEKYDLVIGSRYINEGGVTGWPILRKCISRGGNIYARIFLNLRYKDLTGGFKCYDAKTLEDIDVTSISSQGYTFQIEMTYRIHQKKYKIKEIPIIFKDRVHGTSKMSFDIAWEAIKLVPLLPFKGKN